MSKQDENDSTNQMLQALRVRSEFIPNPDGGASQEACGEDAKQAPALQFTPGAAPQILAELMAACLNTSLSKPKPSA